MERFDKEQLVKYTGRIQQPVSVATRLNRQTLNSDTHLPRKSHCNFHPKSKRDEREENFKNCSPQRIYLTLIGSFLFFHLWCCRLAFTEEVTVASHPTRERINPPTKQTNKQTKHKQTTPPPPPSRFAKREPSPNSHIWAKALRIILWLSSVSVAWLLIWNLFCLYWNVWSGRGGAEWQRGKGWGGCHPMSFLI